MSRQDLPVVNIVAALVVVQRIVPVVAHIAVRIVVAVGNNFAIV